MAITAQEARKYLNQLVKLVINTNVLTSEGIATTGQLHDEYGTITEVHEYDRSLAPANSIHFRRGNAPGASQNILTGYKPRYILFMNIDSIEPYSPSVMTSGFDFKPLLTAGLIVAGVYLAIMALKPK